MIKKFVVMAFVLWSGIFVLNPLESFAECEVHFGSDSHPYCYILNLVKSGVPCQLKFSSNETNEEQLQTLKLCKAVSVLNDEGKCPDTEKDSSGDFCNNIQKGIAGEVCISEIKKDKKRSDIFSASSLCDYGTYLKGVLGSRDCRTSQDQLPLKLGSSNIETIVDRINESNHSVKLDELESALIPTLEKLLKKDKDWTLTGKESLKSSLQALVDKIESEKEGWIAKVRKTGKTAKFKHDLTFESGKTPITIRVYQDGSILLDMPEVKVGKGTFKEVNLGVHYQGPSHQKAHILVARSRAVIKKSNSDDDVKKAIAEYRIQSKLGRSNSGIIKPMFKATLKKRKSEDKVLSLVAPFYEKGDLSQFGKIMNGTNSTEKQNVDEDRIKVSIQLLDQLRFMHEKGIYHRDIKAGNILVRDGEAGEIQVSLTDFGTALVKKKSKPTPSLVGPTGTVVYISPAMARVGLGEVDEPSSESGKIDLLADSDIHAMGLVFYYMMKGTSQEGCVNEDKGQLIKLYNISTIQSYDDLCTTCKVFCGSGSSSEKTAVPSPGSYESIVYKMLNPAPEQKLTVKQAIQEMESLRAKSKNREN